ncbi:MAG: 4-hydroxy-tetrahydrodipicolinate reductase [Deltaproteobacteria bacterium]|nr:4-hydroxy-tetrahydrodipicolinate reductase [Deltaproteobacteria bacterium]
MVKIVVIGAMGRMGRLIIQTILEDPETELCGAVEIFGHKDIGKDVGILCGFGTLGMPLSDSLEKVIAGADCIIDFSTPKSTLENISIAAENSTPLVIGTTGLSGRKEMKQIRIYSKKIPILISPNMSIGMNILFKVVGEIARLTKGRFDIDILDIHHRTKKDVPSGTALRLAESIATARGLDIKKSVHFMKHEADFTRESDEIKIISSRIGDIVGEHTVFFGGKGECIEITHRASNRQNFAEGAILAAKWLVNQKKGLYSMADVLGFNG